MCINLCYDFIKGKGPECVFTAEMENEIVWKYTAGPVPEPVEPTEKERKSLLASIHSNRRRRNSDNKSIKTSIPRRTMLRTTKVKHKQSQLPDLTNIKK